MSAPATALELVRQHDGQGQQPWGRDDWWLLEDAAFRSVPGARIAIAAQAPLRIWRGATAAQSPLRTIRNVVIIAASFLGPVVGGGMLVGWLMRGGGDPMPAGIAGVLLAIGAVASLPEIVAGLRRGSLSAPGPALVLVQGLGAVGAAIGLIGAATGAEVEGRLGLLGVAAGGATSLAVIVLGLLGMRRGRRETASLQQLAEALEPSRRSAIEADLHAAVGELLGAGRIDAETAARARAAGLGMLGTELGSTREPRAR